MGSAGRPAAADFELSHRLAERGFKASPGRLRNLRSEAQIPGPVVQKGGSYSYSIDAEKYTVELLQLLAVRRNLSMATLALFGRGLVPRERALKAAYRAEAAATRRLINKRGTRRADALDRAAAVVAENHDKLQHSVFGRSVRDRITRLKRQGVFDDEPTEALFASAALQPVHVALFGSPSSEGALEEFLDATGIGAASRDQWDGHGPLASEAVSDDLLDLATGMQVDRLQARVLGASLVELVHARDTFSSFLSLLSNGGQVIRAKSPLPDAFGFASLSPSLIETAGKPFGRDLFVGRYTPLMLLISDHFPSYEEALNALLPSGPMLQAQASLLAALPVRYRSPNGFQKFLRLPREERRRLVEAWARLHPDDDTVVGLVEMLLEMGE